MREEVLVKKDSDADFVDVFALYGVSLTADTEDLEAKGEIVHYSYQHNNSNIVDVIVPKGADNKPIRKATEAHLNVFITRSHIPSGKTVQQCWDDFVDYICGDKITIKFKAGSVQNDFICVSELNPTPVYDYDDGSVKTYTCDMPMMQLNSQGKRF